MGKPLKVGGRAERYSRVTDRKAFDNNFDAAFGAPSRKPGLSTVMYRDGKRIVLVDGGKVVSNERPTIIKRLSGISVYDALTNSPKLGTGAKPESTTVSDVLRAEQMKPFVNALNQPTEKVTERIPLPKGARAAPRKAR